MSVIIEQQGAKEGGRSGEIGRAAKSQKAYETSDKPPSHNPQSFYVSVYFILGDTHEYTVNKVIHNIKEVHIRPWNAMVKKCKHQTGICAILYSLTHRTSRAKRAENPVGRDALIN